LTLQEFRSAVSACSATAFLRGEGGKGWRASFDWLIENDTHVAEVLEGKYGAAPAVQVAPALTALDRVKSEVANACNA